MMFDFLIGILLGSAGGAILSYAFLKYREVARIRKFRESLHQQGRVEGRNWDSGDVELLLREIDRLKAFIERDEALTKLYALDSEKRLLEQELDPEASK